MKRIQVIGIALVGLLFAVTVWLLPLSRFIDGFVYDLSLRLGNVDQSGSRVVVVGIDDTSLDNNRLPLVMWHNQLADVIDGISAGGATRLGLDIIPAVSMERLAPELDRRLMRAIRAATKQGTEVILGFSAGRNGVMPEKKFAFAASGLGFLNLFPDPDGVIRRQLAGMRDERGKVAHSIAMLMAKPAAIAEKDVLEATFIDYRQPLPETVSFLEVLQLVEEQDTAALQALFSGKLVLIGGMGVQRMIPFGSPDEVEAETIRLMTELGQGGGYVLAPSKPLPAGTPIGNAVAFIETALQDNRA
jgi:hypothetical protein